MNFFSIGVDLGGTNLRVASYASPRSIMDTITLPTRLAAGPDAVVRDMCAAIRELSRRSYGDLEFRGVAVATPGPLQLPEGILRNPPNLTGWDGFNLRQALEDALGCPIELEGDANVAALAESIAGVGARYDTDSLCMLTLGTGVGSGLVFSGQIWHGFTGMGGEAGHIVVESGQGVPCGCGGSGCLEQYASATAIARMAKELMGAESPDSAHAVASAAKAGDARALLVFQRVGRSLAIALTGLINTLNLPLYVLGGGAGEAWDLFAPTMFKELRQRSYIYRLTEPDVPEGRRLERHKTYVVPARLGGQAGLLGACLLAEQAARTSANRMEPTVAP